jgi:urease accessory protein
MIRASAIIRQGQVDLDRIIDVITLDHGDRHRRRVSLRADGGTDFLLDLSKADVLNDGDAIELETGWLVEVRASVEKLVEIRARNSLELLTLAWHIGNRHVPAEIRLDAIYILYDHVLIDMLNAHGATTMIVERAFSPVRGAYHHSDVHAISSDGHFHD